MHGRSVIMFKNHWNRQRVTSNIFDIYLLGFQRSRHVGGSQHFLDQPHAPRSVENQPDESNRFEERPPLFGGQQYQRRQREGQTD